MQIRSIAAQILTRVIERVGQRDWLAMSPTDRDIIEACCVDAAELQLLSLRSEDALLADVVRRERAHVAAQLANVSSAGGIALETAIWEAASRLLVRTGEALLRA